MYIRTDMGEAGAKDQVVADFLLENHYSHLDLSISLRERGVAASPGCDCWRVLPLGQNVITECQVCLDTDGILCTNSDNLRRYGLSS